MAGATSNEPDGAPRLAMLDILRGIAILGILFMNINDMGQSIAASGSDVRHLGWAPADQVAWFFRELLADGTARCMLELLFGAGMAILTDRLASTMESRWQVLRRYYWRNIVLTVFGLVHIFILLWPGDILHTYGIAALIAFLARRLRPRWLIPLGLTLATVQLLGVSAFMFANHQQEVLVAKRAHGATLTKQEQETLKALDKVAGQRAKNRAELHARIAAEDQGRLGNFRSWAATQWRVTDDREGGLGWLGPVWEATATMLIGIALFKLGVIQGLRSRRTYWWLLVIGYGFGGGLRTYGALETIRFGDGVTIADAFGEYSRIAMTLGHLAAVNLLAGTATGSRLLKPFTAAGRTALSIYILQTIVTLWILFPPTGFHLYGKLSWMPLMLAAVAIDAVLLVIANWWVRRFDIAPVEWAWRSIVEGRALPWRRRTRTVGSAALA